MGAAEPRDHAKRDTAGQGEQQEGAGEQAGDLFRGVELHHDRQARETVLEHGDGGDAEQRAVDRAGAAEDARSAEYHRRDGKEFVTRAGVGLGLPETGGVDDPRERRDPAGEKVDAREPRGDRQPGVAGPLRRVTDRAVGASESGAVDEQPDREGNQREKPRLGGAGQATVPGRGTGSRPENPCK